MKTRSSDLLGEPWTTVRYCFFVERSANWATSALCVMSVLAMTIQPDVSLSKRWTMPGLSAPPSAASLPLQWCSRAFTRVPVWFPAAGWTTMPECLLMTMRWSSS